MPRQIFERAHEITSANPAVAGSTFVGFIINNYAVLQAITVRRQAGQRASDGQETGFEPATSRATPRPIHVTWAL